eukprot:SAG22_NODE_164_length_16817_cov_61.573573_13_plen_62_part_00
MPELKVVFSEVTEKNVEQLRVLNQKVSSEHGQHPNCSVVGDGAGLRRFAAWLMMTFADGLC